MPAAAIACCGAQNFCAALGRALEILAAATRSLRCICHRQRSDRSPPKTILLTKRKENTYANVRYCTPTSAQRIARREVKEPEVPSGVFAYFCHC